MGIRDWVEIGGLGLTALFAFLALRFSNQSLQGKLDLREAMLALSTSFDAKFDELSAQMAILRADLDHNGFVSRMVSLERRMRQSERDHHWSRNIIAGIMGTTIPDESKRDAILAKVDKYIQSRWEDVE